MTSKGSVQHWLMKSEPEAYSIDDLRRDRTTSWDGVRNYQARNFIRDDMRVGDLVLFYHSGANPPGVAGLARICRAAYPDESALDPGSEYHDPKATNDNPIWMKVDLEYVERFSDVVPLEVMKRTPELDGMLVLKRGMRLSIQPVERAHYQRIVEMGRAGVESVGTRPKSNTAARRAPPRRHR